MDASACCSHSHQEAPAISCKLKSSASAWRFVRSVTGYGFDSQSAISKADLWGLKSSLQELDHALTEGDTGNGDGGTGPGDGGTGHGDAPSAKTAAKRDALDYSHFERLAQQIEQEEAAERSNTAEAKMKSQLERNTAAAASAISSISGGLGGEKVEELKRAAEAAELEEEDPTADMQDTSQYFDIKESMAMQGCAHDRSKERALYERPTLEKLRMAKRFRIEGNAAFNKRNYTAASACYQKALLYFEYTFPENTVQEAEFQQDKLASHLNLAAAKLNLACYEECVAHCYQALKMDETCTKAHFRMGQAKLAMDEYDIAEECLKKALKYAPPDGNAAILKCLASLERKRKEYLRSEPKLYRKMLQAYRIADDDEDEEAVVEKAIESTETIAGTRLHCETSETVAGEKVMEEEKGDLSPTHTDSEPRAPQVFSLVESDGEELETALLAERPQRDLKTRTSFLDHLSSLITEKTPKENVVPLAFFLGSLAGLTLLSFCIISYAVYIGITDAHITGKQLLMSVTLLLPVLCSLLGLASVLCPVK